MLELQGWDHGQHHERKRKRAGYERAVQQVGGFSIARGFRRCSPGFSVVLTAHGEGPVSCTFNNLNEIGRCSGSRVITHGRRLRGEIDRGLNSLHLVELALDPGGARGARHPGDAKVEVGKRAVGLEDVSHGA